MKSSLAAGLASLLLAITLRAQGPPAAREGDRPNPHAGAALFSHSDNCIACHNNLSSPAGEDVSIGTAWRSTIMANAARDPYFYASVRRETLDHSSRSREIQDECAACHVPMAQKAAHSQGRLATLLPDAAAPEPDGHDRVARDGVSCTVCHQIASDGLGTISSFNGNFRLPPVRPDGVRDVFGPFAVDTGRRTIMRSATGFEQVEAAHVRQSELCATCHTLITTAYDREGRVIGSLPEQMNYQEWRHSAFYGERRSCQTCHMPRAAGPVRVSSVLGENREGLSRHAFVGGNAFMLRMLNRFRDALGVEAPANELEATARLTEQQLRRDTAALEVSAPRSVGAALEFDVTVRNLTGHKFPTGYPSRRAWLRVRVLADDGVTIFESGALTSTGSIAGNDSDADARTFEPHYDVVDSEDEVQIYESILGDIASRPTTGLLTATQYLKDNRLLPRGFDKATADPQIGVFGAAREDATFAGGADRVSYRVTPPSGRRWAKLEVELIYQPIGYRWAHNLGDYKSGETSAFLQFFRAMEQSTAVTLASVILSN
jgi:mono/diheme cytochrome c family protein